ncbi:MAG: hypothetical protein E7256_00230 [Lachnospiraceae bacterium]|nr:hypothetical protein [Lachnospiraceae bacterium]
MFSSQSDINLSRPNACFILSLGEFCLLFNYILTVLLHYVKIFLRNASHFLMFFLSFLPYLLLFYFLFCYSPIIIYFFSSNITTFF